MPTVAISSLRWKLAALVSALIAVLTAVLLVALPGQLARHAEGWMRSRAIGVATAFAKSLEAPLDFDDAGSAAAQVSSLRGIHGAAYARLLRADGSTLAEWNTEGVGGLVDVPGLEPVARFEFPADRIHVGVPIWARGSAPDRSGTLLVGFHLLELQQQQESARRALMVTSAAVLLLGLLGALGIGSVFTGPIRKVTRVAERIAAGHLEARGELETQRRDETGHMAVAIGSMVDQLRHQQAALEVRVADRTRELAHANEQLEARLRELRATQQQLIVADRRLAVGRLALGVAHEINNPLAYVIANVDHVRELLRERADGAAPVAQPGDRAEVEEALDDAREGAERVRRIVQKLQATSHGDDGRLVPLDLRPILDASIKMTLNEISHRARLTTGLGAIPPVMGNELQLGQVFLNLLINAAQALVRSPADRNEVRVTCSTDDRDWAVITVSDTGAGMAPDVKDRIFDPFFTTKDVGEGAGLGLSICHGIVTAHGGTIGVESAPGLGSTFTVSLPPAPEGAVVGAPPSLTPQPNRLAPPGRLSILLVDDDERVAAALRRTLRRSHDVRVALGGVEALSLLRAGVVADRVVCDLMMPDMTGMDLYAALQVERPDLARTMVFISGGAFTEEARDFAAAHRRRVIAKPVDVARLLGLIQPSAEGE